MVKLTKFVNKVISLMKYFEKSFKIFFIIYIIKFFLKLNSWSNENLIMLEFNKNSKTDLKKNNKIIVISIKSELNSKGINEKIKY